MVIVAFLQDLLGNDDQWEALTFNDVKDNLPSKEKLDNGFKSTERSNEQDVNLLVRGQQNQGTGKDRF